MSKWLIKQNRFQFLIHTHSNYGKKTVKSMNQVCELVSTPILIAHNVYENSTT